MNVIALRGDENKGKSETMNAVYQMMLLFGYTQVVGHFRMLNKDQKDFFDILERKGQLVGLVSLGDYDTSPIGVPALLDDLEKAGCDVAICTCRNTQTPLALTKITTTYPKHWIIDKAITKVEADQRILNGEDAERIYKLI